MSKKILIDIKNLKVHFPKRKGVNLVGKKEYIKAVDDVNLTIYENETLGLVGESGCGKSTLGKAVLQLIKQTSGTVSYNEVFLDSLSKEDMRKLRKEMQIIFQDPYSSLNPRLTVSQMIQEGLIAHGLYKKNSKELDEYTLNIMKACGLDSFMLHRYPHQFSGGQRQRICIARALALKPKFIVCDESVSTLDVSIQSQIINLLLDLKEENNLTYLFISHDLGVVRFISDRIAVMYLGNIVELAPTDEIFTRCMHPYTKALLSAIPSIESDVKSEDIDLLEGDLPSSTDEITGCKFHPRCKRAKDICKTQIPENKELRDGHFISCHFPLNL